jgi:hypothetical protein
MVQLSGLLLILALPRLRYPIGSGDPRWIHTIRRAVEPDWESDCFGGNSTRSVPRGLTAQSRRFRMFSDSRRICLIRRMDITAAALG